MPNKRSNKTTPTAILAFIPDRAWLGLVLLLGTIVRFIGITKASVWHDEGYTMMLAPQSPAQILLRTGRDVHPPLYYLTLHYWIKLFGTSELAVRSLSAILMLGVIVFSYLLVKRLFGNASARLAALFVALAPFLVRYSQEARMYGMLAFIAALATYLLVRAQDSGRWLDWIFYAIAVAAGLYTYYYVIFMIVFHWCYILISAAYPKLSLASLKKTVLSPKWIGANALAVILWLPWVPTAYIQLTKIQSPPWIDKATLNTLPASFGQFMTFTDVGGRLAGLSLVPIRNLIFLTFIALLAFFLWQRRRQPLPTVLMLLYMSLTPVLVWLLSFGAHPKYVDRYFVFAAVAFYALLAIVITEGWPWRHYKHIQRLTIAVILLTFAVGISNVYAQANHKMRQLTDTMAKSYQPGDQLVSGDFYTFFDFNYYATRHHFTTPVKAYVPNDFPGCCEGRSMLYDRPDLVLKNWQDLHSSTGYVWVVGRPGSGHDYFDQLPSNWQRAGEHIEMGSVAAQRFKINPTQLLADQPAASPPLITAILPSLSGRLIIKDLGISIGIPSAVTDLKFQSNQNYASLTSTSLVRASQQCEPAGLGVLSKILKTSLVSPTQADQSYPAWQQTKTGLDNQVKYGRAKEFDSFYILYQHPQSPCFETNTAGAQLQSNQLDNIQGLALTAELL